METIDVPDAGSIEVSLNLLAEGALAVPAYDALPAVVNTALVQAPSVLSTPAESWIGNDDFVRKLIENYISAGIKGSDSYHYASDGPLGIPALTISFPVELTRLTTDDGRRYVSSTGVNLAGNACMFLDVEIGHVGAWGPDCKVERILQMPRGTLTPKIGLGGTSDTYWYTPRRAGTDTMRYIVENGAGKRVDVTVRFNSSVYRTGALDEASELVADASSGLAGWAHAAELSAVLASAADVGWCVVRLPGAALAESNRVPPACSEP